MEERVEHEQKRGTFSETLSSKRINIYDVNCKTVSIFLILSQ